MPTRGTSRREKRRWPSALLLCGTLLILLAGCSLSGGTGSGSSSLSLGLAGTTADQPATPPALAAGGPAGTYAFVYDNQVWLQMRGQPLKQLTHLVLSNGANIAWGPLDWSPSGKYIAFALVQNLDPASPSGSSGPIYVVDTTNGTTIVTGGTGSLYGHTYAWYGDNMLFYSSGGSVGMFGPYGCDICDPRTWTVLTPVQPQGGGVYSGQSTAYDDLAITDGTLYYSQISLQSLGAAGNTGTAYIYQTGIFTLAQYENAVAMSQQDNAPTELPAWLAQNITLQSGGQIADLGRSYAGPEGSFSTGAWALTGNNTLIVQHIDNVDTKGGRVSSSFCAYDAYGNCTPILRDAGKAPLSATPGLTVAGSRVAYTNGTLYVANADGSHEATLANAGWTMPPAVSPDGKLVAVTQLVKQSTSASGVVHSDTNVIIFDGSNSLTFVPGGQDFSWKP